MDLLGDIGNADQLTSAREENKVLTDKCKEQAIRIHELKMQVEELKTKNLQLEAELEIYRSEFGGATAAQEESKESLLDDDDDDEAIDFVASGNGVYATEPEVTLPNIHGQSNPLCCALDQNDTLLATGSVDSTLKLTFWGKALAPGDDSASGAVDEAVSVPCGAPVICCSFAQDSKSNHLLAAGCMDGHVRVVYCGSEMKPAVAKSDTDIKHRKYVKCLSWSPAEPILASASADGTVQITRVSHDGTSEPDSVSLDVVKSLHFDGAVECLCFVDARTLCCYVRDTSYLSYFDMEEDFKQTKCSLNATTVGGFDDHVSFVILQMVPSPQGKYIALATDASRHIIMEIGTERIVRNLYGVTHDSFSNPGIAWSQNGQYLYGNCQNENSLVVWDVASTDIARRIETGGHTGFIR